jgi:hypothetical protein
VTKFFTATGSSDTASPGDHTPIVHDDIRITEDGDTRITENDDTRILETA